MFGPVAAAATALPPARFVRYRLLMEPRAGAVRLLSRVPVPAPRPTPPPRIWFAPTRKPGCLMKADSVCANRRGRLAWRWCADGAFERQHGDCGESRGV